MKELFVSTMYETYHNCWLSTSTYIGTKNLSIELENDGGPIAMLTVNIAGLKLQENEAFVDTNNFPQAEDIIKRYKLGVPTIITRQSGLCVYRMWRFDLDRIKKYAHKEPKQTAIQRFERVLEEALWQADFAAQNTPDKGTYNMDSCLVKLPRLNHEKVIAVCKKYGIEAYKCTRSPYWDVGKCFGMSDRNRVANEKMSDVFREMGYESAVRYIMD